MKVRASRRRASQWRGTINSRRPVAEQRTSRYLHWKRYQGKKNHLSRTQHRPTKRLRSHRKQLRLDTVMRSRDIFAPILVLLLALGVGQDLISHSAQDVRRRFWRNNDRAHKSGWDVTQHAANGASETLLFVFLHRKWRTSNKVSL